MSIRNSTLENIGPGLHTSTLLLHRTRNSTTPSTLLVSSDTIDLATHPQGFCGGTALQSETATDLQDTLSTSWNLGLRRFRLLLRRVLIRTSAQPHFLE